MFKQILQNLQLRPYNLLKKHLNKSTDIDFSFFPKLNATDIEESFVRGSGPGGQNVNKTANCVVLRHLPTNIVIKCHIHRSVTQNQKEARNILLHKLDNMMNGEMSIEAQTRRIETKKIAEKSRRQKKIYEMKKKWIERENLDNGK